MNLRLEDGTFVMNCTKVLDKDEITPDKRVFYELGEYTKYDKETGWSHWRPSGVFKEVTDVEKMLELDHLLQSQEYLNHHNFYICEKEIK